MDARKVIEGLMLCLDEKKRPFESRIIRDAVELLRAQEPVEPKWQKGYAYCGQCGYKLHWIVDLNNFCPNCGQAVKWG